MDIIQSNDYSVFVGENCPDFERILNSPSYSSHFILVDKNIQEHCLPILLEKFPFLKSASIIEIPAGEEFKNLETCTKIWDHLFKHTADRKAALINLGGGVITDMGAFSASVYKRGISFFQIPTSLLSMVDASVGGKTGIDFLGAKNILGTFSSPLGVWINPEFLKTLSETELRSGMSEIIKHGLIADRKLFQELGPKMDAFEVESINWEKYITTSVQIKNRIVLEDPLEFGARKLLNFGHTIGHALESYFLEGPNPLNHGQAIAMGMICEAYLSSLSQNLSGNELKMIIHVLKNLFPNKFIPEHAFEELFILMQNDKKNDRGVVNFTFLKEIGVGKINQIASKEQVYDSFRFLNSILDL